MLTIDDFPTFFRATTGFSPFAWQTKLVQHLAETGRWPDRLVAPTGAGKTSAIDAHVFCVALNAVGVGARVPRRLAMIVDRRVLVDDQYARAEALSLMLMDPARLTDGSPSCRDVVDRVADALRGLYPVGVPDRTPLLIARLRGGEPASRRWREQPAACCVICATPDMWGSRLLLRGYGSTRQAWPVEAGLLAMDAAVVVDEAHLAHQVLNTARRVADLQSDHESLGPMPLQCVETSATPTDGREGEISIGVESHDLDADEVLARRLRARKDLRVVRSAAWPMGKRPQKDWITSICNLTSELVAAVSESTPEGRPHTVGCFVNTVKGALAVHNELTKRGLTVAVVCGRLRPIDVRPLITSGLLTMAGDSNVDALVTTQSLEVGVDIDLAGAVSELAPAPSLVQRAGRVNRRGDRPQAPFIVVTGEGPIDESVRSGPYVGGDLRAAHVWLEALEPGGSASPLVLRDAAPPTPMPRILHRLERYDLWHLARTSAPLSAEPDLNVWLSDDLNPDLDVGIVVRAGLTGDAVEDIPRLAAVNVHAPEVYPVSIGEARAVLTRMRDAQPDQTPVYRIDEDAIEPVEFSENRPIVRPGDVLIVAAGEPLIEGVHSVGVVSRDGNTPGTDRFEDAADEAEASELRLQPGLPLANALGANAIDILNTLTQHTAATRADRAAFADVLATCAASVKDAQWRERLSAVSRALKGSRLADFEVSAVHDSEGEPAFVGVADRRRRRPVELVEMGTVDRPYGPPVYLDTHQEAVAKRVLALADGLSIAEELRSALRTAAEHHDDGKADTRFQRALRPGGQDAANGALPRLLAKSGMTTLKQVREARAASGLPARWRHEQASAATQPPAADAEARLVLRLIGTTHGHGRPSFPHDALGLSLPPQQHAGAQALFEDALWDDLVEETHSRLGVWGCAYLEALVRAADVQVSGEGS